MKPNPLDLSKVQLNKSIRLSKFTKHDTQLCHYNFSSHFIHKWTDRLMTLWVFGVGRRTVGHGPGSGSSVAPVRTAGSLSAATTARRRSIRSLDDVAAATECHTTSRFTVCGSQLGTSGRLPHHSNYFRWINSTSGLGPAPQTERRSTPAHGVQRFRHSAVVFTHFPGFSHFSSPAKSTSGSGFDPRTRFPIGKWICSRLSPSLNWLYP